MVGFIASTWSQSSYHWLVTTGLAGLSQRALLKCVTHGAHLTNLSSTILNLHSILPPVKGSHVASNTPYYFFCNSFVPVVSLTWNGFSAPPHLTRSCPVLPLPWSLY